MNLEIFMIVTAFGVQCIGLWLIMLKIEDIQTMLLKMQVNELERLIAEQNAKKATKDALMKPYE
jgi:hypothetical protein